jgi:hypothetical protein
MSLIMNFEKRKGGPKMGGQNKTSSICIPFYFPHMKYVKNWFHLQFFFTFGIYEINKGKYWFRSKSFEKKFRLSRAAAAPP